MAEQNKNEGVIQLPWTVPQQLYYAEIQVDPSTQKIPLDLNVSSTDTTAISSFALSVIIALILSGFATWLAYEFAKKSFDLTKQSFDALKLEIESKKDFEIESKQREIAATYFNSIEKFIKIVMEIENENNKSNQKITLLKNLIDEQQYLVANLSLYYSKDNAVIDKIFNISYGVRFLTQCVVNAFMLTKNPRGILIKEMIQEYRSIDYEKDHLDSIEKLMKKYENSDLISGVRETVLMFLNEIRSVINKKAA